MKKSLMIVNQSLGFLIVKSVPVKRESRGVLRPMDDYITLAWHHPNLS